VQLGLVLGLASPPVCWESQVSQAARAALAAREKASAAPGPDVPQISSAPHSFPAYQLSQEPQVFQAQVSPVREPHPVLAQLDWAPHD
jgi:hypothetical protein